MPFENAEYLIRCVNSLYRQLGENFEIILAENEQKVSFSIFPSYFSYVLQMNLASPERIIRPFSIQKTLSQFSRMVFME